MNLLFTGVQSLNADNGVMGVAIGFHQDHFVSFHLVSVIAGNSASLSEGEYDRRHVQLLKSIVTTVNSPYIVPYYQGGGQWHATFSYSDRYFHRSTNIREILVGVLLVPNGSL
jgi:hypothetical protein